jgi:hypothetical protein
MSPLVDEKKIDLRYNTFGQIISFMKERDENYQIDNLFDYIPLKIVKIE